MNVLVTGGGGFLGRRVAEMLLQRGDQVRVLGRHRYENMVALGADSIVGDVRNPEAATEAARGADAVVHCAALAGVWGARRDFFEINVKGTANVIHACLENKITALVHTSSPSVAIGEEDIEGGDETLAYPKRYLAHYPASKAEAEKMVLDADGWEMVVEPEPAPGAPGSTADSVIHRLRTCALRPHLIWGPRDTHLIPRVVDAARAGTLRRVGDGSNKVDVTYIDNAAHAHVLALDDLRGEGRAAGRAYFIGDAEPVVLWQWLNELLARVGIAPIRRGVSYRAGRCVGAVLELIHTLFPALGEPRMTRFVATQLAKSHYFSHARAEHDFGYNPIVGNAEGLDRLTAWLQNEYLADEKQATQ